MSTERVLPLVAVLSMAAACSSGMGAPSGGSSGNDGARGTGDATGVDGGSSARGPDAATGGVGPGSGTTAGEAGSGAAGGGPAAGDAGSGAQGGGGSGDAATSADGAAAPVAPTSVAGSGDYRFTFGDVVFEVNPQIGGRVEALTVGGTAIVAPPVADATQWGSVFWTSPQTNWKPASWPPPTSFDSDPYTGGPSGNDVVLASATDPLMGLSVAKDYAVDGASGWIHLGYTIHVTTAFQASPWENTRVPRGGLAFFPAGAMLSPGPLTLSTLSGIVWFDDSSKSAMSTGGAKAIADGMDGWLAYALDGVLFLKKFTDTPVTALAPGEGEVDLYPGPSFLEVEVQGPYTAIPDNGSLSWGVQWRVAKIPASVTVSAGSASLVAFAEQQAAM